MWVKVITQVLIHFGTILAHYLIGVAKKTINAAKFKKQAKQNIENAEKLEANDASVGRDSLP